MFGAFENGIILNLNEILIMKCVFPVENQTNVMLNDQFIIRKRSDRFESTWTLTQRKYGFPYEYVNLSVVNLTQKM